MSDFVGVAANLTQAGEFVNRAVRAAVAPGGMVERKIRPESTITWEEPAPLAGLRAALAVARIAERRAHEFAVKLRGEGTSWTAIADLFDVPYDDGQSRAERVYEAVVGPLRGGGPFDEARAYWECGGPLGCGQYITDRGPYERYPEDNENGHAEGCRRLASETEAQERAGEERERRSRVIETTFATVTDPGDRATVERCWWTIRHGGQISGKLSTTEQLAVAIVLDDAEFLRRAGYSTRAAAIEQVYETTPDKVRRRLAVLRQAATGEVKS